MLFASRWPDFIQQLGSFILALSTLWGLVTIWQMRGARANCYQVCSIADSAGHCSCCGHSGNNYFCRKFMAFKYRITSLYRVRLDFWLFAITWTRKLIDWVSESQFSKMLTLSYPVEFSILFNPKKAFLRKKVWYFRKAEDLKIPKVPIIFRDAVSL